MARHGHSADTKDWQAHHRHHGGHQGNNIPLPTFIHRSSKGNAVSFRIRRRCNHLNFASFNFQACGFVLVGPKIIIIVLTFVKHESQCLRAHLLTETRRSMRFRLNPCATIGSPGALRSVACCAEKQRRRRTS